MMIPKADAPSMFTIQNQDTVVSGNGKASEGAKDEKQNSSVAHPLTANRVAAGSEGFSAQTQTETRYASKPVTSELHMAGSVAARLLHAAIFQVQPDAGCKATSAIARNRTPPSTDKATSRVSGALDAYRVPPAPSNFTFSILPLTPPAPVTFYRTLSSKPAGEEPPFQHQTGQDGHWQTVALVLLPFIVQWAQRYFCFVSAEICEALFIGGAEKDGLLDV